MFGNFVYDLGTANKTWHGIVRECINPMQDPIKSPVNTFLHTGRHRIRQKNTVTQPYPKDDIKRLNRGFILYALNFGAARKW
jgi:hypothetical protein